MNDNFLNEAKRKVEEIRQELQSLMVKKASLDAQLTGLTTYISSVDIASSKLPNSSPFNIGAMAQIVAVKRNSVKDQVILAVASALADGKPRHTSELLEMLTVRGIEVGGKNKMLAVSSILSREKSTFAATRKEGWSLRTPAIEAPSESAASQQLSLEADNTEVRGDATESQ